MTEIDNDSSRMALQLAQYTSANARTEAESIAVSLDVTESIWEGANGKQTAPDLVGIDSVLHQHAISLQNGFAIVYRDGRAIASFQMPQRTGVPAHVKPWIPQQSSSDEDSDALHGAGVVCALDEIGNAEIRLVEISKPTPSPCGMPLAASCIRIA